jgi:hypothetical protein
MNSNVSLHPYIRIMLAVCLIGAIGLGVFKASFAKFSSSASNVNNQFTASTIFPTPTQPDLISSKTNNIVAVSFVYPFIWKIRVQNSGSATASFSNTQELLKDERTSTGVSSYASGSFLATAGGGATGTVNCTASGTNNRDLTCTASGNVSIPAGGYFDISYPVTPTTSGTLDNPRSGAICKADRNTVVTESNETNNDCSNSVIIPANCQQACQQISKTIYSCVSNNNNKCSGGTILGGNDQFCSHYCCCQ